MEPSLTHRITRQDAELALERAQRDADWLASLRDAYTGRHDVLDALWWVAHPLTPTPGGTADPAAALRGLQAAVFSREAIASPLVEVADGDGSVLRMREAESRLWQLQRTLAEDARCLEQAWLATHPALGNAAPPPRDPEPSPSVAMRTFVEASSLNRPPNTNTDTNTDTDTDTDPAEDQEGSDTPRPDAQRPPAPTMAPRRTAVTAALVGAGLLAAIVLLPALPGLEVGADPSPTETTPSSTPHVREEVVILVAEGNVTDPLAVLARPQEAVDEPSGGIVESFAAGSFRKLPDLVGFLELYLARNGQGDSICLIAVRVDGASQGTCVRDAEFAEQGIHIGNSGDRYQVGPDMTILSEAITLNAVGDFRYEARARAPARSEADTVFPSTEHYLGS